MCYLEGDAYGIFITCAQEIAGWWLRPTFLKIQFDRFFFKKKLLIFTWYVLKQTTIQKSIDRSKQSNSRYIKQIVIHKTTIYKPVHNVYRILIIFSSWLTHKSFQKLEYLCSLKLWNIFFTNKRNYEISRNMNVWYIFLPSITRSVIHFHVIHLYIFFTFLNYNKEIQYMKNTNVPNLSVVVTQRSD